MRLVRGATGRGRLKRVLRHALGLMLTRRDIRTMDAAGSARPAQWHPGPPRNRAVLTGSLVPLGPGLSSAVLKNTLGYGWVGKVI